jgi:hypothetical protein
MISVFLFESPVSLGLSAGSSSEGGGADVDVGMGAAVVFCGCGRRVITTGGSTTGLVLISPFPDCANVSGVISAINAIDDTTQIPFRFKIRMYNT